MSEQAALTPEEIAAERAESWTVGSIAQMRRKLNGRCVTCTHWTPPAARETYGSCGYLGTSKDGVIELPSGVVRTSPYFGCTLWTEIEPVLDVIETEQHGKVRRETSGPMRERTQFAIDHGVLPALPDADSNVTENVGSNPATP